MMMYLASAVSAIRIDAYSWTLSWISVIQREQTVLWLNAH